MKPWIIGGHYIANNHKDDYILCYARTVTTIIEKWDNSEQQKKKVQEIWQQWENLCARELLQTQALCVYPCAINMALTLFRPTKKNTGKHPGVKLIATVTFTVSSLPQGKPIKSLDNGWSQWNTVSTSIQSLWMCNIVCRALQHWILTAGMFDTM